MKKFFLAVSVILVTIFLTAMGVSAYKYYRAIHADDPIDPYLLVDSGAARIVRGDVTISLSEHEKYSLKEKDTIITEEKSEATLFWPDRSTTQLGAETTFAINKMQVAEDYSKIELEATLMQGKIYTDMIRTLYPGSRMSVRIPEHNIVAGVRGTVFSLNLTENYIHSIDHAVMLENNFFQSSLLLPGEIASVTNIFEKLGREVLDQIWEDAMMLKNEAYKSVRADEMGNAWKILAGNLLEKNYWDEFMRWILSFFDAFKELEFVRAVSSFDTDAILKIPSDTLTKLYQNLKIGDFALERDMIRGTLYELSKADIAVQNWLETMANDAIWDKISFPTIDLKNSEKILDELARKTTIDFDAVIKNLSTHQYSDDLGNALKKMFHN
ncbi:FecR domain-containing protein [Candidatus Gracilibacteria bacterium]|nr:FecR domain-containing protein [Candidatus Gracilibacteria bacterium]